MKGWRDIPIGGIITNPGNSVEYKTGSWRSLRPVIDLDRCTHCMFCWVYCPEGAVIVKDGKVRGINLDFCKGCGICARECPRRVIEMVEEHKLKGA